MKRSNELVKCEICNKEFYPWEQSKYKQKFCSYICAYIGRKKKEGSVEVSCSQCGKRFNRAKSLTINHKINEPYKRNYCSMKCRAESERKRKKGNKNPNWKDGVSKRISAKKGKGNKLYNKGKYYENKVRKELEAQGFYIIRSAASKGLWDIIAVNSNCIRFIQAKANNLPRPEERENLANFKCPINSTKEIWRFFGMGKKQIYIYKNGWNIKNSKKQK